MPYTRKDAIKEVGDSEDWAVGLEASIKKWEQRVADDVGPYSRTEHCGLCFVVDNRKLACCDCPSWSICELSFGAQSDKEILQALKNLRGEIHQTGR